MAVSAERIRLPHLLVAYDGRQALPALPGPGPGILLRDTDLGALTRSASLPDATLAVEVDTVAGLDSDDAAVRFVTVRLGIRIVLTRHPQVATLVAELGGLALLHVLALDSTGLTRGLDAHPRSDGVGTAVSPGLVLPHLRPRELAALPRPLLAYGLIASPEAARAVMGLADGIVVRPAVAAAMAALEPGRTPVPGRGARPIGTS